MGRYTRRDGRPRKSAKRTQRQMRYLKTISHKQSLKSLGKWLFRGKEILGNSKRHGNAKWQMNHLIWLALIWSWTESENVTDAFDQAADSCRSTFGSVPLTTYQGFMGALTKWTPTWMPALQGLLQNRMREMSGDSWRVDDAFCSPNYGKSNKAKSRRKKKAAALAKTSPPTPPVAASKKEPQEPQVWITMMWYMVPRLPMTWRLGPTDSSERAHVAEMIANEKFPKKTLFCGDAGFTGHALWSQVIDAGQDFLIRVGGNVKLLTEWAKENNCTFVLGSGDEDLEVLCWPRDVIAMGWPPLRLRLIRVMLTPKTHAWLLTSVRDPRRLSATTALRMYKMRWGIEVAFRGLKQTLAKSKLRCHNSTRLLAELHWAILSMAVAELFAMNAQRKPREGKSSPDPGKRSLVKTLRALRAAMRHPNQTPKAGHDLASRLRRAVTDGYVRKRPKRARYRRKNPDKKPLGDPRVRVLTVRERKKIEEFETK
jgi:Transposase DDE domain